jgi:hypothetical protein
MVTVPGLEVIAGCKSERNPIRRSQAACIAVSTKKTLANME